MAEFQLVLLMHAHQPVGNFEDVFERSTPAAICPSSKPWSAIPASAWTPLFRTAAAMDRTRSPRIFRSARDLSGKGQVEMIGGGFYEPILIAIPARDRLEQLKRLADYLERHFSAPPARHLADGTGLGAATSLSLTARRRRVHPGRRQPFPFRGIASSSSSMATTPPKIWAIPSSYCPVRRPCATSSPFVTRRRPGISCGRPRVRTRRICSDGRRPREIRRLARHARPLLHQRVA